MLIRVLLFTILLTAAGTGFYLLQTRSVETPVVADRLPDLLWQDYKKQFILNGRVVDHGNGGISHSEGQGYGMLLAEAAGDHAAFNQIWQWTKQVLQREDGLFSWRYEPCPSMDARCITDSNNASDAELLLAWALLRAYRRWQEPDYLQQAEIIANIIVNRLLIEHSGQLLILPGEKGFQHGTQLTLNPSYWVFPALDALNDHFPDQPWERVIASGHWLLSQGRFGNAQLPPDWVLLDGDTLHLSERFPPRYSYNAVRVPLHLVWSSTKLEPAMLTPFLHLWRQATPPAWVDLQDNRHAGYGWTTGMMAIANLVQIHTSDDTNFSTLPYPSTDDDYFSTSLTLLSHVAANEIQP